LLSSAVKKLVSSRRGYWWILKNTWLVKCNPSKTEIMIFNIRNQQDELSFDFDGIVLNSVNKHKHLGISFSSDCKWTEHIDSLVSPHFFILLRSILIIFFKVDSSKAVCPIDVSSAKSLLSPSMSSAMSFMNTKNNRSLRTDSLKIRRSNFNYIGESRAPIKPLLEIKTIFNIHQ
jgi:hypothetical protein